MSSNLSALRILLCVAMILFVFIGLILPPTARGPRAHAARVLVEIKGLERAIAAFKARFGVEPPSRIILHEKPARHPYDLEGTDPHARIEQRTVACFQKIWPEFPILTCAVDGEALDDGTVYHQNWVDFNRNGVVDDELDLDGAECLVFFLGGMINNRSHFGFDRNPRNPFGMAPERIGPFFEFGDERRLIDRDGDGFREHIDLLPGQTAPFLYFSSYGGTGYNFSTDQETADNGAFQPYYLAGDPQADRRQVTWYKATSFQIISPGYDAKTGSGGLFPPEHPEMLSPDDWDNFTNFRESKLRP